MFLGIDIGTSGVKAVLLTSEGSVIASASAPLTVSRPHPMWSEQDPDDWWRATEAAVLALDSRLRASVQAIGLSGQMHGATLLNASDRPLRPAILWNDGRSQAQCVQLEGVEPRARQITGNIAMPGFTAPKLAWVRQHEPAIFDQISCVLLPKDYVRLCMTGDRAADMSDAAGTLWLDCAARDWSDAMLAATGLSRAQMPALHEGTQCTGALRADVASRWGMAMVPVAAGGSDNAAGAIGAGAIRDGDALLSLGTSGVIFVATDDFRPNPDSAVHAFCHALPGLWHQMAVHLSAASCIDWAGQQLGLDGPADLFAIAAQAASGPELFFPFLSGERTPHNDPRLRAGWLSLDSDTTPSRLALAVLEGVAFAHADGLDALRAAGTQVDTLSVIGGGSRSLFWGGIIASILDVPLDYLDDGAVGPALGAARLALMAESGADAASACARPAVVGQIGPDPQLAEYLARKRRRYRSALSTLSAVSMQE